METYHSESTSEKDLKKSQRPKSNNTKTTDKETEPEKDIVISNAQKSKFHNNPRL